jgi:hypothetical protein
MAGTKEGGDKGEENDEGTHGRGGKRKSESANAGQFAVVVLIQARKNPVS